MMRILLPVLLLVAGLGGGVAAGKMLSGGGDAAATEGDPDAGYGEEGADESEDDGYGDSDGYGDAADASSPYEYVRLNNQFIVPVIRHGSVRSLVVLSLTVEVLNGENTLVYDREPRLRDAFLRVMFSHANVGGFDGSFTTVEAMAPLRSGLLEAARQVLGDVVNDVLIVDIVRQDA
jgi:flagellar protein FliL